MGAHQSTDAGSSTDQRATRTCHYELLGVDRQASEDEIKKAYRKKALELHPDRNYGKVEETTKQFAEVQSAYDILSDPQERAWYDSHRDAILGGSDVTSGEHFEHNVRITTTNDILRLFTLFNAKVDFSDSPTGFYGVLRETFDTLANEEQLACEWEGLDPVTYPSFGHADDGYEDVVRAFYAAWNGFATRKTFRWEELYRCSEAPDRRVRRMMEKENKRFREEGIREFNDAVRSLLAFVKKRDPRFKQNVKSETERQKILRDAAVAQAARQRAANQAKHALPGLVPEWMKSSEAPDDELFNDVENTVSEQFECIVCNKSFKSENQYETHEKSRKHIRAVQHIKRQMQQDEKSLQLNEFNTYDADKKPVVDSTENPIDTDIRTGKGASGNKNLGGFSDPNCSGENFSQQSEAGQLDSIVGNLQELEDGQTERPSVFQSAISSSDDEYTSREKVHGRILDGLEGKEHAGSKLPTTEHNVNDLSDRLASQSLVGDGNMDSQRKIGKAKDKRAKKAARKLVAGAENDTVFKCAACQAGFPSRTRLFNHIKDLNHAQSVPRPPKGSRGKT